MLYKRLIINGTEYFLAVAQSGKGAPTAATEGSVGVSYMDEDTGVLYKCTGAAGGVYTWEPMGAGGSGADGGYYTPSVSQPATDKVQFDFTPSKAGMPAVQPATVTLPGNDSTQNANFDPSVWGLPILALTGDLSPIRVSKENVVTMAYVYGDRSGTCTLKGQGSSSYNIAQGLGEKGKFNYTIKFDNAFEVVEGWGEQKKYCLKANYIDHSHARNVVSAKLWGEVVRTRTTVPEKLNALPNCGAIDGFPIIITLNGKFHGLYTFNIPKDGWMLGMSDSTLTEAIVCADIYSDATWFQGEAALAGGDFELEYVSDEDNADWVLPSLNQLLNAVINSNGADLDTTVAQYLDWDSAIDYYIFSTLLNGVDMAGKNYILATFDGVKWFHSAYDMDCVYGLDWDGKSFYKAYSGSAFGETYHRLRNLILAHKRASFKSRYRELRAGVMSDDNVTAAFTNFIGRIPTTVYIEDVKTYPSIPNTASNNLAQIVNFYCMRAAKLDAEIDALPDLDDSTMFELGYDLVPTSEEMGSSEVFNGSGYRTNCYLAENNYTGIAQEEDVFAYDFDAGIEGQSIVTTGYMRYPILASSPLVITIEGTVYEPGGHFCLLIASPKNVQKKLLITPSGMSDYFDVVSDPAGANTNSGKFTLTPKEKLFTDFGDDANAYIRVCSRCEDGKVPSVTLSM